MSPDPLRLFEDAGTSGELRDDLRHAQRAEASAYDVQSGLERFSAFIGAGPTSGIVTSFVGSGGAGAAEAASAGGAGAAGAAGAAEVAAGAGAAAKVASSSLAMKVMAGALVLGLAGAGAARIASPNSRTKSAVAASKSQTKSAVAASNETTAASAPEAMHWGVKPVVVGPSSPEPPGEARDDGEAAVDRGRGTPRATAATPVAPVASAPRDSSGSEPAATRSVKEETEHLGALRSAARADQQTALRMADEGHARFPNGIFWQEREVVAITSLVALGRRDEARSRAEAFLARYPDSPSADRLRRAVAREQ